MAALTLSDWMTNVTRLFRADAVLLAAWDPSDERSVPLLSSGYSTQSQLALLNEYPRLYSVATLTEIYGGMDPLVYTIGAQPPSRMPFRQSLIYREALSLQGFRDGLTIQLRHGVNHVGYAHFSTIEPDVFDVHLQRHGRALINVLSQPIVDQFSLTGRGCLVIDGGGVVDRVPGDLLFREDDAKLRAVALAFLLWTSVRIVSFFWADGRNMMKITLERHELGSAVRLSAIPAAAPHGLTSTELRVLTAMVVHNTNEGIASALGTSVRTIHTHIANTLRKLGCGNRTQAVVLALKERTLMPDSDMLVALADWALNEDSTIDI